jgi:hypothetical protein
MAHKLVTRSKSYIAARSFEVNCGGPSSAASTAGVNTQLVISLLVALAKRTRSYRSPGLCGDAVLNWKLIMRSIDEKLGIFDPGFDHFSISVLPISIILRTTTNAPERRVRLTNALCMCNAYEVQMR